MKLMPFFCIAAAALCTSLVLGGCAAVGASAVGQMTGAALESLGLKKPDIPPPPPLPDAQRPPRTIALRLDASQALNMSAQKRPLSLVVRIYKLRQSTAFLQTPYDAFLNPAREKEALGADLLEVREMTLIPGQRYQVAEKVPYDVPYIGIVALFLKPAPNTWRVVFPASESEKSGILIGVQSCSLTIGEGASAIDMQGVPIEKNLMLSPVQCQP